MPRAFAVFRLIVDHLVGAHQYTLRYFQVDLLSGLEVQHQLVLRRRLHRQIGRLLALEDAVDIGGGLPEQAGQIRA